MSPYTASLMVFLYCYTSTSPKVTLFYYKHRKARAQQSFKSHVTDLSPDKKALTIIGHACVTVILESYTKNLKELCYFLTE